MWVLSGSNLVQETRPPVCRFFSSVLQSGWPFLRFLHDPFLLHLSSDSYTIPSSYIFPPIPTRSLPPTSLPVRYSRNSPTIRRCIESGCVLCEGFVPPMCLNMKTGGGGTLSGRIILPLMWRIFPSERTSYVRYKYMSNR